MEIIIEKKKYHEGVIGEEYREVYGEYEEEAAKKLIQEIVWEYEDNINSSGFELTDNDKINDIYSVVELLEGEYDFDCDDFIYYITIKKGEIENGS